MFNNPTFNNRWLVRPANSPAPIPALNREHAAAQGKPFRLIPVVVFKSMEKTNEHP